MIVGMYADPHITKRMGSLQSVWEESVISTFSSMYKYFESKHVEFAICLGDMFDKAVLEARSVSLVNKVLDIIDKADFTTYILLGNHEIDSTNNNILSYIAGYRNIETITSLLAFKDFLFIPYNESLKDLNFDYLNCKYAVTHHDFYGVELAGGKVKASFGDDPEIMKSFHTVFNGHIHTKSKLGNIVNLGSLLNSSHGVFKENEFPSYYIYDTEEDSLSSKDNKSSILYRTITPDRLDTLLRRESKSSKIVLRFECDENYEIPNDLPNNVIGTSVKKKIVEETLTSTEIKRSVLDVKNILSDYIENDANIDPEDKSRVLSMGISLLEENKI